MRCLFCSNPDTWTLKGGNKTSSKEIAADIKRVRGGAGAGAGDIKMVRGEIKRVRGWGEIKRVRGGGRER